MRDRWLEWSRKPAGDLDEAERFALLANFFKINWDNLVKPFPRYWELLNKRGLTFYPEEVRRGLRYFSRQEFLDLQVWFNLAWCGYTAERLFPELRELKRKGRAFTEEEKAARAGDPPRVHAAGHPEVPRGRGARPGRADHHALFSSDPAAGLRYRAGRALAAGPAVSRALSLAAGCRRASHARGGAARRALWPHPARALAQRRLDRAGAHPAHGAERASSTSAPTRTTSSTRSGAIPPMPASRSITWSSSRAGACGTTARR